MRKMLQLVSLIDQLSERVGRAVSWFSLLLVLVVVTDVFFRYGFNLSAAWVMELEWHIFTLLFVLSAAYTFRHDKHVRVDVWYQRFSPRDQALVNLLGNLILLLPWLGLLIYTSTLFAVDAWTLRERSPDPGGLPARYLVKGVIPLGLTLLFLQAIADSLRQWQRYNTKEGEE
jgi:TRAP-type mannitol/chloroaromatic compound transport system permease small subunit